MRQMRRKQRESGTLALSQRFDQRARALGDRLFVRGSSLAQQLFQVGVRKAGLERPEHSDHAVSMIEEQPHVPLGSSPLQCKLQRIASVPGGTSLNGAACNNDKTLQLFSERSGWPGRCRDPVDCLVGASRTEVDPPLEAEWAVFLLDLADPVEGTFEVPRDESPPDLCEIELQANVRWQSAVGLILA